MASADLRHCTSASHLAHRASPPRRVRLGSRSPTSIPSSPTSVRSSSSAIFERDIEPLVSSSHSSANPHRIPRAKTTEHLEHSVPSVLDSAASVLATLEDSSDVAVIAPAQSTSPAFAPSSGFASPIGSFRSRSPSPLGLRVASGHGGPMELLLNIPTTSSTHTTASPISNPASTRSTPAAVSVAQQPFISSPTPNPVISPLLPAVSSPTSQPSDNLSGGPSAVAPSEHDPATATVGGGEPVAVTSSSTLPPSSHPTHHHSMSNPPPPTMSTPSHRPSHSSPISITTSPMILSSHPPSPTAATINISVQTKRLSFMSYSDLLTSTPSSLVSLSSLTSAASTMEPPPHIPSVNGYSPPSAGGIFAGSVSSPTSYLSKAGGSATASLRGFVMGSNNNNNNNTNSVPLPLVDDNLGGEWEREGLGKGLEERLEAWIKGSEQLQQQQLQQQHHQQRSTSFGSSVHYPPMIGARI